MLGLTHGETVLYKVAKEGPHTKLVMDVPV